MEHIDIFPTLVELANLPQLNACPHIMDTSIINLCAEGKSLVSSIAPENGNENGKYEERNAALVQTMRPPDTMGFSLVTEECR